MDARIAKLFEAHAGLVYRRALQLLGSTADAEEATQIVFVRAAKALPRFRPTARVTTWLYRITTNYCLNVLRDRGRRRILWEAQGVDPDPAPGGPDPEKLLTMRRLLAEADPREAEAAVAVFVDGMSHAEAAAALGVSRRTVGNLCERFVTWARDRLEAP